MRTTFSRPYFLPRIDTIRLRRMAVHNGRKREFYYDNAEFPVHQTTGKPEFACLRRLIGRPFLAVVMSLLLGGFFTVRAEEFLLSRWVQPVPRHWVLAEPGYYVWGGSVVEDGGQYHMFYARWPTRPHPFADGWIFGSEICHAVADNPGGPFVPTGVVLGQRTNDSGRPIWDGQMATNPHIRKFGNRFFLYYVGAADPGTNIWPGVAHRGRIQHSQRIGVISAMSLQDLLTGNFIRPNAPIISPVYGTNSATDLTRNPTDIAANRIVNNPSVTQRPDGKYQLLYKSNWPQKPSFGHGFALATNPEGPFTLVPSPGIIFSDEGREDENHWYDPAAGKYFLLIKNFGRHGTEQFVSSDSTNWTSQGIQLDNQVHWADGTNEVLEALERPQLLRDHHDRPIMLYMAARRVLAGGVHESFNVHIPLRPPVGDPNRAAQ